MVYKFETNNAELFASKMSKNGYRLFIMVDHENETFIYGQSKSDRDALVQLFNYCGRNDFYASYKPSRDEFSFEVED